MGRRGLDDMGKCRAESQSRGGEASLAVCGNDALGGERKTKAPAARFAPIAEHATNSTHGVIVYLSYAVQVQPQSANSHGQIAACSAESKGISCGERTRVVQRGRV